MKSLRPDNEAAKDTTLLLARFMTEFSFQIARSEAEREQAFRLRHDVYCEEIKGIPPTDPVRRLEYDIFDNEALHCLVRHRTTGLTAACTRLVTPLPGADAPLDRLPLQSYAEESLYDSPLHPDQATRGSFYEISRLAISPHFRPTLKGKQACGHSSSPDQARFRDRRTFSFLANALFLSGCAVGRLTGTHLAYAMMEPRLHRLLSMSGFHFTQVGGEIDLHGKRRAYCISRKQAEAGMNPQLVPLYQHIQKQLSEQLESTSRLPQTAATNL
ncbi:PEP-CTERM/exosortase system-associated acyltransferase [Halomonas icarae]|uniref:PEP-CTERM/exosortase system-associated acyltransferase n=1 Tax=Halomonas icarae TaxID=2691040 RepID=A0A7X4W0Y7_9GAMM|nr:PEP-CTERM/exosortase system-associated acyltransferase [Halomonas icarae]MDR5901834.1 PEP-CTERM/exosortase system-associated acyltransferase [Halomonas icarae]NAW12668.1 PEP-CTERM/exosortase system-associated acyltransferase [Halomonas icarae]